MISYIISILFKFIYIIIIFSVLLSWVPIFDKRKEPVATIILIYNTIMKPFQAIIPPIGGVLDVSPILAFLIFRLIENCIYKILIPMGL